MILSVIYKERDFFLFFYIFLLILFHKSSLHVWFVGMDSENWVRDALLGDLFFRVLKCDGGTHLLCLGWTLLFKVIYLKHQSPFTSRYVLRLSEFPVLRHPYMHVHFGGG